MRKYEVLKAVVILQAVCMVVLTVVVVIKVWPMHERLRPETNVGSEEEALETAKPGNTPNIDASRQSVATIGSDSITAAELEEQLYQQYGDSVLRVLMVHKVIDLEAAADSLKVSSEELDNELQKSFEAYDSEARFYEVMKEQLGMTREQVLEDLRYKLLLEKIATKEIRVTDAEVERYIADNPDQFTARLQLHLQWILTDTEQEANSILGLLASGEDFAMLAKTYSIDEFSAETGGDIGLIDSDDPFYNRNMLDTASRLQVAESAGPIEVDGDYAIIRLTERQMTTTMTGKKLQDSVRKQLALERAGSLTDLEDELLNKYEAAITRK